MENETFFLQVWININILSLAVSFQIVIMAAIRDFSYGGIAIDSIRLSPGCRKASGNTLISVYKSIIPVLISALSIGPFLSPFVPLKQIITPLQNSPTLQKIRVWKQTRCVTSHQTARTKRTKPSAVCLPAQFHFPFHLLSTHRHRK